MLTSRCSLELRDETRSCGEFELIQTWFSEPRTSGLADHFATHLGLQPMCGVRSAKRAALKNDVVDVNRSCEGIKRARTPDAGPMSAIVVFNDLLVLP